MTYRIALAKLLPSQYVNDFLDGNLYLNTCSYFSSLDRTDSVRADPNDGLFESRQVSEVAIQDEQGNWIPIGGIINPVTSRNNSFSGLNILCLYAMTDREGDSFDQRNISFGDSAILIMNLPEFLSRVKTAASNQSWGITHAAVEYVKREAHDGYMGPFRKFEELSYQNEFRFVFETGIGKPCRLPVGNLRDITRVVKCDEIPLIWSKLNSRK